MGVILFTKSDRLTGWTRVKEGNRVPVNSDGAGYYAHMARWFVTETNDYQFTIDVSKKYKHQFFEVGKYNKFYIGTSVMLSPFYLIGHAQAKFLGVEQDGYTWPYLFWTCLGMIFYAVFAAIVLGKILDKLKVSGFTINLVIVGLFVGTQLTVTTIMAIPMSHVLSFFTNLCIIYFTLSYSESRKSKHLFFVLILLGLSFIIRPTNALLLVLLPFLFNNLQHFIESLKFVFKEQKKVMILGIVAAFSFLFLQILNTHSQSGEWKLNSYNGEGFDNWLQPKILDVLFSFSKGLFIYSPILLLVFPAYFFLYKKNKYVFKGIVLFSLIYTYVISSWWCWWYGGGLGMRPYVDVLFIFFIPIAVFFDKVKTIGKVFVLMFALASCYLVQIYEQQFNDNILHYDKMTANQFKRVFMQRDRRFEWCLFQKYDTIPETHLKSANSYDFYYKKNDLEKRIGKTPVRVFFLEGKPKAESIVYFKKTVNKFQLRFTSELMIEEKEQFTNLHIQGFLKDSCVLDKYLMIADQVYGLNTFYSVQMDFIQKDTNCIVDKLKVSVTEEQKKYFWLKHPKIKIIEK